MASPQEYHGLLTHSLLKADRQTFLSIAPEYFKCLGQQIIDNLLYQVQRFNTITRRIWLFGFAATITTTVTASLFTQHKPTFIMAHAPVMATPHVPIIALIGTIALTCIPIAIIGTIKSWLYHLMRKTESIMNKKAKAFAEDAWLAAVNKRNPIPQIEDVAFARYHSILKNLSRFNY